MVFTPIQHIYIRCRAEYIFRTQLFYRVPHYTIDFLTHNFRSTSNSLSNILDVHNFKQSSDWNCLERCFHFICLFVYFVNFISSSAHQWWKYFSPSIISDAKPNYSTISLLSLFTRLSVYRGDTILTLFSDFKVFPYLLHSITGILPLGIFVTLCYFLSMYWTHPNLFSTKSAKDFMDLLNLKSLHS